MLLNGFRYGIYTLALLILSSPSWGASLASGWTKTLAYGAGPTIVQGQWHVETSPSANFTSWSEDFKMAAERTTGNIEGLVTVSDIHTPLGTPPFEATKTVFGESIFCTCVNYRTELTENNFFNGPGEPFTTVATPVIARLLTSGCGGPGGGY